MGGVSKMHPPPPPSAALDPPMYYQILWKVKEYYYTYLFFKTANLWLEERKQETNLIPTSSVSSLYTVVYPSMVIEDMQTRSDTLISDALTSICEGEITYTYSYWKTTSDTIIVTNKCWMVDKSLPYPRESGTDSGRLRVGGLPYLDTEIDLQWKLYVYYYSSSGANNQRFLIYSVT